MIYFRNLTGKAFSGLKAVSRRGKLKFIVSKQFLNNGYAGILFHHEINGLFRLHEDLRERSFWTVYLVSALRMAAAEIN